MAEQEPVIALTYNEVRAAAKKAFDEGRLQAQNEVSPVPRYLTNEGTVCAIGAALPKEIANRFDAGEFGGTYGIGGLIEEGIVSVSDDTEKLRLGYLQNLHDNWLRYGDRQREAKFKGIVYAED